MYAAKNKNIFPAKVLTAMMHERQIILRKAW
jgi:hypothetical protein